MKPQQLSKKKRSLLSAHTFELDKYHRSIGIVFKEIATRYESSFRHTGKTGMTESAYYYEIMKAERQLRPASITRLKQKLKKLGVSIIT